MKHPACWFEIPVRDLARATAFYTAVFGCALERADIDGNAMALFPDAAAAGGGIGGALARGESYAPSADGTRLYFATTDIAATLARVASSGGRTLYPRTSVGALGHVAEFEDSEGNRIALHEAPPGDAGAREPAAAHAAKSRPAPPELRFAPCDPVAEREALVAFLAGDRWEFFGTPVISAEKANAWIDEGFFASDEAESHWILGPAGERVGHIRLFDLLDPSPLFDLRIRSPHRGKGIGPVAVRWIVGHLFAAKPGLLRVEAQTRRDNRAMRAVLDRCGFAKEAHYREAWPDTDGTLHDGVGYAILRRDFESGRTTPVDFAG